MIEEVLSASTEPGREPRRAVIVELQEVAFRGLRGWVATRSRILVADRTRFGRPLWAVAGIGASAAIGLGALLVVQGWRPVDEMTALVLVAGGLLLCAGAVTATTATWRA